MDELGKELGLTRKQVHEIQNKALEKLRHSSVFGELRDSSVKGLCDYTLVGPMKSKYGACESVSKLLVYLCRQAGIPAVLVTGKCRGNGHAWVKVWAKNRVRYIDITEIQECPLFFRLIPCFILMPEWFAKLAGYRDPG